MSKEKPIKGLYTVCVSCDRCGKIRANHKRLHLCQKLNEKKEDGFWAN